MIEMVNQHSSLLEKPEIEAVACESPGLPDAVAQEGQELGDGVFHADALD